MTEVSGLIGHEEQSHRNQAASVLLPLAQDQRVMLIGGGAADASAARRFRDQHRWVIYKSISGQRSIVNRLGDKHESRMADLRWCPTQFQCWVPGIDHCVHVVGEQVFVMRVLSDAIDYRYDLARMEPCQVPNDVAARCLSLLRSLGLLFAGVDLRRTTDGEWVCFEVNPSPAYSCYEFPDRRISFAVSHLLALLLQKSPGQGKGQRIGRQVGGG